MDKPDFAVGDHGSIVSVRPLTKRASKWLKDHCQSEAWQWLEHSLNMERRYAFAIVEAMEIAGLRRD